MRASLLGLIALLTACPAQDSIYGPPTGATCPETQTLTWENFGQPFMTTYCTRCHDSHLDGAERHGAPTFHDFDTVYGVRAVREHIDETTAAGPAAVNTGMPVHDDDDDPVPTMEERVQLGEWLACKAPQAPFAAP